MEARNNFVHQKNSYNQNQSTPGNVKIKTKHLVIVQSKQEITNQFKQVQIKKDLHNGEQIKQDSYNDEQIKQDSYNDEQIKQDSYNDEQIKQDSYNDEQIKQEPTDQELKVDLEELYADHEVKEEMVLGPVLVQCTVPNTITNFKQEEPKCKYICNVCGNVYKRRRDMTIHYHMHTKKKSSKLFDSESNYYFKLSETIIRDVPDDRPPIGSIISLASDCNKCEFCKKQFAYSILLQRHIQRVHTCQICLTTCNNAETMKMHKLTHKPKSGIFNCEFCDKTFTGKYNLKQHVITHSKLKPFGCVFCEERFYRKYHLIAHEKTHFVGENFKCSLCDTHFKSPNQLQEHKKNCNEHVYQFPSLNPEGSKRYTCDICNKSFARRYLFNKHKVLHSDINPFACCFCEKRFLRKSYLKRHEKSHFDKKYLNCPLCDKVFLQRYKLQVHKKMCKELSTIKPIICDMCKKRYKDKSALIRHIRNYHRMK